MSRMRVVGGLVACSLVVLASGVAAQDAKSDRREKLKKAAEIAAEVAVQKIPNGVIVNQGDDQMLTGQVVMLQGKAGAEATEVNRGGLVVVRIPDSGSRPPLDIKVDAGRQFARLGQLRGVAQKKGKPLAGGGFTWVLLKPVNEGDGTVVVSFAPNGGEAVKREYKLKVVAGEAKTNVEAKTSVTDSIESKIEKALDSATK